MHSVTFAETGERVELSLNKAEILIGDTFTISTQLWANEEIMLDWLGIDKSIQDVHFIKVHDAEQVDQQLAFYVKQKITASIYDSGMYQVGPFEFPVMNEEGQVYKYIKSDSAQILVQTIEVDTTQPIKPIKGIITPPLPLAFSGSCDRGLSWWQWSILGTFLLWTLIALVFLFVRRPELTVQQIDPGIPPHEKAILQLQKLQDQTLWQQGHMKQYYIRLSEICREYIEARFQFPAMENTTEEIVIKLQQKVVSSHALIGVKEMLELSDLVKFAKVKPVEQEHLRSIEQAYEFVRQTRQIEIDMEGEA